MSGARKLQTEIDRVMKKVDEGVELFDEIWEKVYSAEQQNQKEKYEMDLKKEIKKLQRLRDQIKTWIGSSDVKDKDGLVEARKLIETKMEQFKVCEKETKTKTYSKEGLARADRMDPAEQAKYETTSWIQEYIEKLQQLLEDQDVELERLQAGKGKKTNKTQIEDLIYSMNQHRFHISKLEGIMRLVNNDRLPVDIVDPIREDLDYYFDAHDDDDYQQAYDEDFFYETLGLEELDVVNVDHITQAATTKKDGKEKADELSVASSKDTKSGKKEKKSAPSIIPLTIGRARTSSKSAKDEPEPVKTTPSKITRSQSGPGPAPGPVPTPARVPPPPAAGGASMAAILKREQQDQEKERQQKALLQQQRQQQELLRQQELQRQQQAQQQQQEEQLRQQELQRQQQAQKAQQEQQLRQQQQLLQEQQQRQAEAVKQLAQKQAEQNAAQQQKQQQKQNQQSDVGMDVLNYGLGGLSLNKNDNAALAGGISSKSSFDSGYLSAINESFAHMPTNADSERQRQYTPRNPYPSPASYPNAQTPIFDNPAVFEKLGTDALFFIFYYAQGTYQQYLAARELKKQSWRYHKKYMTWFQRHEEPTVKTDEYEQGTYVYFDYEGGWCQRLMQDFRFDYSFLEDSLQ